MLVKTIEAKNFAKYAQVNVELPASGIVLITGKNGAGKSTIIEAVSTGIWGKTLRGATPWQKDVAGFVTVSAGDVEVTRKSTKGGKVSLDLNSVRGKRFNTQTKAKEALESAIMSWDLWKRTHVFSSHDASHFTLATDGERKRLIEAFLGLECFDGGLKLCREDLRLAERDLEREERELTQEKIRYSGLKDQKARAEETLRLARETLEQGLDDEEEDKPPTPEEITDLENAVAHLREALSAEEDSLQTMASRMRELEASVTKAETKLEIKQNETVGLTKGKCPTCHQDIPKEMRESIIVSLQALVDRVKQVKALATTENSALEKSRAAKTTQIRELRQQVNNADGKLRVANERVRAAKQKQHDDRVARAEQRVRDEEAKVASLESARVTLHATIKGKIKAVRDCADRVKFLKAVEGVLGLRGVRTQVLGHALSGIESLASYWLAKITDDPPNASLELKPYSEKGSGAVSDKLSLIVHGFGGGYGYKAASGGERRRVDVSLTMAMATVANAAQGIDQGTLFFDEVFDSLDASGVAAVSEALSEMAKERPIVVISHSRYVQDYLDVALHLEVNNGTIKVL